MALVFSYSLMGQTKKSAFKKAKGAVVKINASELPEIGFRSSGGSGTGYIASPDGYIITNHHVIDGAVALNVIVTDQGQRDTIPAYTLWSDNDMDIAVLKIDRTNLPYLKFAEKNEINQGDEVLALGYPGGSKDLKVTWGIISGVPDDSTLNTTAALNSGNSGGPCINLDGKVVGTIFAKKVSVAVEGTGFLRSVEYATNAIEEAKKNKDSFKELTGTDSKEAYMELCKAEAAFISINYYEDNERSEPLNEALYHIKKSIELDPNYILAYFFKASFELYYAFYQCEIGEESRSSNYADKFYNSLTKARELDADDGKYDRYNATIDNELQHYVDENEVDCEVWNDLLSKVQKSYETKDDRLREFDAYIKQGKRPEMLADILGAYAVGTHVESDFNYGFRAGLLWANHQHYETSDFYSTVSMRLTALNVYLNFSRIGVDIAVWREDIELNDEPYASIDFRFGNIAVGFSPSYPENGLRGVIPKYSLKYLSDDYYTATIGYNIGIGYHDIGVATDDFGLFDKLSISSQVKILNLKIGRTNQLAVMIHAQTLPGKYLSTGLQIVYHGFGK